MAARMPLDGFHFKTVRRLAVMMLQREKGKWIYPNLDVLTASRPKPLRYYLDKYQCTISRTIRGLLILEASKKAERRMETALRLWW